MGIPTVSTCCCGCTLKVGTQVIGWIELISYIIALSSVSLILAAFDTIRNDPNFITSGDIEVLYGALIVILIICVFQLLISFLLLWGVQKDKPSYLKPWLIFAGINIIFSFITMIMTCVSYAAAGGSGMVASSAISSLAGIFLKMYCFVVVRSYSLQLSSNVAKTAGGIPPGFARTV